MSFREGMFIKVSNPSIDHLNSSTLDFLKVKVTLFTDSILPWDENHHEITPPVWGSYMFRSLVPSTEQAHLC